VLFGFDDADQAYDPAHGRDDATIETFERTTVEGCRVRTGRGTGNTRADALCGHPTLHIHLRDRRALSGHVLLVGFGGRRTYARVPLDATPSQAPGLAPSRARDLALPGRFHAAGSRIA
jgi:hypothetical protein